MSPSGTGFSVAQVCIRWSCLICSLVMLIIRLRFMFLMLESYECPCKIFLSLQFFFSILFTGFDKFWLIVFSYFDLPFFFPLQSTKQLCEVERFIIFFLLLPFLVFPFQSYFRCNFGFRDSSWLDKCASLILSLQVVLCVTFPILEWPLLVLHLLKIKQSKVPFLFFFVIKVSPTS